MKLKQTIVGAVLLYLIQILRELRDKYLGKDRENTVITPNPSSKKKWDSWIRKNVKKHKEN